MRKISTPLLCYAALLLAGCAEQRSSAQHTMALSAMQRRTCLSIYPDDAHYAGYGGKTVVAFTANADGTARDIVLDQSSGHASLDEISLGTLRQCNVVQAFRAVPGGRYKVLYGFQPPNRIYLEKYDQE